MNLVPALKRRAKFIPALRVEGHLIGRSFSLSQRYDKLIKLIGH
jgi:hypothetical protein